MNINAIHNSFAYSIQQTNVRSNEPPTSLPQTHTSRIERTPEQKEFDKNDRLESKNDETQNNSPIKKEAAAKFAQDKNNEFTKAEEALINELKQVDQEVHQHEMAHVAAGGRYIISGANFSYKTGPDGNKYAVGGEVKIDTSPVPGDPEATISKMRQVRSAALAPADPSSQDRKVASTAMAITTKAMSELMMSRAKQKMGSEQEQAFGNIKKNAVETYSSVQALPENQTESSFRISA